MPWTKDELDRMTEREIAEAVMDEINIVGDYSKRTYNELNSRMDSIEVAFKRPSFGRSMGADDDRFITTVKDIADFTKAVMSIHGQKNGVFTKPSISRQEYESYQKVFDKYLKVGKEILQDYEQKDLQIGVGPDGGITVTPYMSSRILETISQVDPVRRLCSVETITTSAWESLYDDEADSDSEPESCWEAEDFSETTAPTKTKTPKLKKLKIPAHTLFARPLATQNLLEDSGINVEQWLARKLSRKFGRDEGKAFVVGTGVGQPKGFLTYTNGTSFGEIEQVSLGAADAITADGLIDLLFALKEEYRQNSAWLMNNRTIQAVRKLKTGDGDYLWQQGLMVGQPSTLLGVPVYSSPNMPEIAADALAVAIGDWREGYTIIDRIGMQIIRDQYSVKPFVEFYTRKRVGAACTNFEAIKIGKISE